MNAKEARKLTEDSILSTSNKTMADIDEKSKVPLVVINFV